MIALDTNILIYATQEDEDQRRSVGMGLVEDAVTHNHIVPVQVMAEYLAVLRRKLPNLEPLGPAFLESLVAGCQTPQSTPDDVVAASALAQRHQMQYFDALILTVAARAGASTLYSEDMQNGLRIGPLTVVNPFRIGAP